MDEIASALSFISEDSIGKIIKEQEYIKNKAKKNSEENKKLKDTLMLLHEKDKHNHEQNINNNYSSKFNFQVFNVETCHGMSLFGFKMIQNLIE